MESLFSFDTNLLLWLNSENSPWLDQFFWYCSEKWIWIPVYFSLLFFLLKKLQLQSFLLCVLCIGLLVTASDQLASGLFKQQVKRLRPTYTEGIKEQLHLVKEPNGQLYKGGKYGFYSSHASNYMAVVVFFIMVVRPLKKIWYFLLFFWVLLISLSRIYMGVHFPSDILMGWIMGASIALFFSFFFEKINQRISLKPR